MPIFGIGLLAVVVLLLIGAVPVQSDGRPWSQSAGGILGGFLVVLLLLASSIRL